MTQTSGWWGLEGRGWIQEFVRCWAATACAPPWDAVWTEPRALAHDTLQGTALHRALVHSTGGVDPSTPEFRVGEDRKSPAGPATPPWSCTARCALYLGRLRRRGRPEPHPHVGPSASQPEACIYHAGPLAARLAVHETAPRSATSLFGRRRRPLRCALHRSSICPPVHAAVPAGLGGPQLQPCVPSVVCCCSQLPWAPWPALLSTAMPPAAASARSPTPPPPAARPIILNSTARGNPPAPACEWARGAGGRWVP